MVTHDPVTVQSSSPSHPFPFEHATNGVMVWDTPLTGSHTSAVQGFPSSRLRGVPGMQLPAEVQALVPLQTFPSVSQLVPAASG